MAGYRSKLRRSRRRVRVHLRRLRRNNQFILSVLAAAIGVGAAYGAIGFRHLIDLIQLGALGFSSERVFTLAAALPWWHLVLAPTLGGLAVGIFVRFALTDGRPQAVADVIEATVLRGNRMSLRDGIGAALASAASIGVGASVGREGPVVHLGATIASWVGTRLHLGRSMSLILVGCGIASGIAALFNAPIAGVFFALEVVIGNYALSAFAPIVVASVIGTIISRIHFGDFLAFAIPSHIVQSFWEFPAFALLGVISALVAMAFMRAIMLVEDAGERSGVPRWLRPAIGGLLVGLIALAFPQVLGVGYEATDAALKQQFSIWLLASLVAAKLAATALSLGLGFGGGVFSPSLVVGAMLGGAFGLAATGLFPELFSGYGVYALVGMGAVAGAVLGAPISTILIVFEMTADFELTLAVMIAVVIATVITRQVSGHSFFTWQLERRGVDVNAGREIGLLRAIRVRDIMDRCHETVEPSSFLAEVRAKLIGTPFGELFVTHDGDRLEGTIAFADLGESAFDTSHDDELAAIDLCRRYPPVLDAGDTLETAIAMFGAGGEAHIPVVEDHDGMRLVGVLHERDTMLAYHRALIQARKEERGEL
jgi:CIC family chloride channel protein